MTKGSPLLLSPQFAKSTVGPGSGWGGVGSSRVSFFRRRESRISLTHPSHTSSQPGGGGEGVGFFNYSLRGWLPFPPPFLAPR